MLAGRMWFTIANRYVENVHGGRNAIGTGTETL
jgi:hypothetical protein